MSANGCHSNEQTMMGLEVTGPDDEVVEMTRGVCGRDAKCRPTGSSELFAPSEPRLAVQYIPHVGLSGTEYIGITWDKCLMQGFIFLDLSEWR